MKSILQSIALLSAAALIASCDSSSGGGSAGVGTTPPAPQVSATGSAVKGVIDGATVTVIDADGDQVGTGTATAGTYDITYDASVGTAGIADPLTVNVTGGTTICDFDNPDNSGNDCRTGGTPAFVSFGQTYTLPADFVVRSVIANASNGGVSHITAGSEIAVIEALEAAGTASLTPANVNTANAAISGLIETLTGISLGGVDITQIATANLNSTGGSTSSEAAIAIAAFNAAVLSAQADGESLGATISRLAGLVSLDANGNVVGTGTNLGILASAVARGLATAAAASGNASISNAVTGANSLAAFYTAQGNNSVTITPQSVAGSDAPVTQTKAFVLNLAQIIGEVASSTGAEGFGGQTNTGATEAFANELAAVEALTSGNATIAFNKLDTALKAAAATVTADNPTVTNAVETGENADDGVEFVLTRSTDGTLTATGISSRWPLASTATNNQVTLTGDTASATTTLIEIPAATLTSRKGTAVAQTFTGSFTNAFNPTANTDTATLSGTVTGATAGTTLTINASVTDLPTEGAGGTYSAAFGFTSATSNNLTLTFSGTVGALAQNFIIAAPSGGINGTATRSADGTSDVITLSDGQVTLTLTAIPVNGSLPSSGTIGTFTVVGAEASTGTLDGSGQVTYSDSTVQFLPAIIFPE